MAADPILIARLDALVDLFNRRSMDLPDGLFTGHTQFLLNGTAFETLLGRSPSDPLILMLARGPAGYRFAVKGLQHAIPDAAITRGEFTDGPGEAGPRVVGQLWLSGRLRGTGESLDTVIDVTLDLAAEGHVRAAGVTVADVALEAIRAARLRD